MATAALRQYAWRLYSPDGATADLCTALASQNVTVAVATTTANRFMVRVGCENDNTAVSNTPYTLEYSYASGTFVACSAGATHVRITDGTPTDGSFCTAASILTGFTAGYAEESDGYYEDTDATTGANVHTAKQAYNNNAWTVYLVDAAVTHGVLIRFRVTSGAGTWTYTSYPSVTVNKTPTFTGTGSVAVATPTLAGSGKQGHSGSGAMGLVASVLAGVGLVGALGTGAVTVPSPSLAGAGHLEYSGSGAIIVATPTLAGSGALTYSGSGGVSLAPTLTGSGTAALSITGTGDLALAATLAGEGTVGTPFTGDGALAVAPPTLASSGLSAASRISLRQSKHVPRDAAAGTTVAATFDAPCQAGSLIVVVANWFDYTPVIVSVEDDQSVGSNTYSVYGTIPSTDANVTGMAYALNIVGGEALTVTVTFDEAEPNRALTILEYEDVLSAAALDDDSTDWSQFGSNPPDAGTITPTEDNELIVAACYCNLSTGFTPASGFVSIVAELGTSSYSVIHEIQTTATQRTSFWTAPSAAGTTNYSAIALSFKRTTGITGSGAIAVPSPSLAANGTQEHDGTGALALSAPALAGSGLVGVVGSGDAALAATLAGAEVRFDDLRRAILDAITSSGSEPHGWDVEKANLQVTDVVRTSDTVVTITLSALAAFDISSAETLTVAPPAEAFASRLAQIGVPTFEITVVSGFSGSGSVAVGTPALAGAGTVTQNVTGSGAITVGTPALAGTGQQQHSGTGAITVGTPSLAGTGQQGHTGTGAITVPAPTLAAVGTQQFTGSGSIAVPVPTLAGTGSAATGITGTGDVALVATLAGTGTYSQPGTGSVAVAPSLAGSGLVGAIGAGAITVQPPALAASGHQEHSGSGGVGVATPTLAGSGLGALGVVGDGSVAVAPSLAGAGTQTQSGSGAVTVPTPSLAGAGLAALGISGSGSVAVTASLAGASVQQHSGTGSVAVVASLAGTGTTQQQVSGSGAITLATPSLAGVGPGALVEGPGSVAVGRPSLAGSGSTTDNFSGSGGVTVGTPSLVGVGLRGALGTGAVTVTPPTLAGTGTQQFSGSGSVALALPTLAATGGDVATGTGSLALALPTLAASGEAQYLGTGSVAVAPVLAASGVNTQNVTGTGDAALTLALAALGNRQSIVTLTGKYAPEHRGAKVDIGAARGFGPEHSSALKDIGDAGSG